jgi:hypothetical protein
MEWTPVVKGYETLYLVTDTIGVGSHKTSLECVFSGFFATKLFGI